MKNDRFSPKFSSLLQMFFLDHLLQQKNVSPQTVASYRDTFRLLLNFAKTRLGKSPAKIALSDINSKLVLSFLKEIEKRRNNSVRTRNTRLTAIRSFMYYAALHDPLSLPVIQGVLAIPLKRFDQPVIEFFSREEIAELLNAPDSRTWCGRRDRAMLTMLYNTGARVSEVINMKLKDLVLEYSPSVNIHGKGRKERTIPLWTDTALQLKDWIRQIDSSPNQNIFPNRTGGPMSRTGVTDRLKLAAERASKNCPRFEHQKISPHRIRHSTACHLLESGIDLTVIALWLGHENPSTTHSYVEASLEMKKRALDILGSPKQNESLYKPDDSVMMFLDNL